MKIETAETKGLNPFYGLEIVPGWEVLLKVKDEAGFITPEQILKRPDILPRLRVSVTVSKRVSNRFRPGWR